MNDQAWLPRLAITTGEPAGIGPEIVAALAATDLPADLIAIGDKDALLLAAQTHGIALTLETDDGQWRRARAPGSLRYVHVPAPAPIAPALAWRYRRRRVCWCGSNREVSMSFHFANR